MEKYIPLLSPAQERGQKAGFVAWRQSQRKSLLRFDRLSGCLFCVGVLGG